MRIKKRLNAYSVTAEKKFLAVRIVYCKSKNTVELFGTVLLPKVKTFQHDFGIARCIKNITVKTKFTPYLLGIVNFAVIHNYVFAEAHRLFAVLRINDAESPVNKSRTFAYILSSLIRSTHFE